MEGLLSTGLPLLVSSSSDKVVKLVGGGSFINGATLSSLLLIPRHTFLLQNNRHYKSIQTILKKYQIANHRLNFYRTKIPTVGQIPRKTKDIIVEVFNSGTKLDGVGPVDNRPSTD